VVLGNRCHCGFGYLESRGGEDASPRFTVLGRHFSFSV